MYCFIIRITTVISVITPSIVKTRFFLHTRGHKVLVDPLQCSFNRQSNTCHQFLSGPHRNSWMSWVQKYEVDRFFSVIA